MAVCPQRAPIEVAPGTDQRVACWLPAAAGLIPPGGSGPLAREEIASADEA